MRRTQNSKMRELLSNTDKCELCGGKRSLEVHHIIPVSLGGPEEDEDNMIVVCHKCHAQLTPHSILSKLGIANVRRPSVFANFYKEFYTVLNEYNGYFDAFDVLDLFDDLTNKYSIKYYGSKANDAEFHKKIKPYKEMKS